MAGEIAKIRSIVVCQLGQLGRQNRERAGRVASLIPDGVVNDDIPVRICSRIVRKLSRNAGCSGAWRACPVVQHHGGGSEQAVPGIIPAHGRTLHAPRWLCGTKRH